MIKILINVINQISALFYRNSWESINRNGEMRLNLVFRNELHFPFSIFLKSFQILKAPFSVDITPRCGGGRNSGLFHFTLDPYHIVLSGKQGGIKYHILNLWYDSTWDWTPVSQTIGEHFPLSNYDIFCYKFISSLFKFSFEK